MNTSALTSSQVRYITIIFVTAPTFCIHQNVLCEFDERIRLVLCAALGLLPNIACRWLKTISYLSVIPLEIVRIDCGALLGGLCPGVLSRLLTARLRLLTGGVVRVSFSLPLAELLGGVFSLGCRSTDSGCLDGNLV